MKKLILGLVAGLLIGSVGTVAASSPTVQAVFQKFVLDIEGQTHNIEPLVYQGTTYLPVREVADLLGYKVDFKNATKTIQLKGADNMIVTEEWITLNSIAQDFGLHISVGEIVTIGGLEFKRPSGTPNRIETITTDKGTFQLKIENGVFFLKTTELKELGIIN